MPGKAASTVETCVLGAAPNAVAAPENSLARAVTWAWTSRPITVSHFPVRPSISFSSTTRYNPRFSVDTRPPDLSGRHQVEFTFWLQSVGRARRAEKRSAFRRNIGASDNIGGLRSAHPPYGTTQAGRPKFPQNMEFLAK